MASSTSALTAVPYIDLQPDYDQVLRDVGRSVVRREAFWVSGYQEGKTSVHGKVSPAAGHLSELQRVAC